MVITQSRTFFDVFGNSLLAHTLQRVLLDRNDQQYAFQLSLTLTKCLILLKFLYLGILYFQWFLSVKILVNEDFWMKYSI